MTATSYFTYNIFFSNGSILILDNVNITVDVVNREITQLDIKRDPNGDSVEFINISEIISIVKRAPLKKKWWK